MQELPEYLFHKKKANIVPMDVGLLFKMAEAPEQMRIPARSLVALGWTFQVVDQKRGHCYYKSKVLTIPLWVLRKSKSELRWYISHEMSHAFTPGAIHGPVFMEKLKEICPINDQHWEYGYKPQQAKANGLSVIGVL